MALSQLNAIFLLKDVALLLYTLLISKGSQFLFKLKKIRPSFKSRSRHGRDFFFQPTSCCAQSVTSMTECFLNEIIVLWGPLRVCHERPFLKVQSQEIYALSDSIYLLLFAMADYWLILSDRWKCFLQFLSYDPQNAPNRCSQINKIHLPNGSCAVWCDLMGFGKDSSATVNGCFILL